MQIHHVVQKQKQDLLTWDSSHKRENELVAHQGNVKAFGLRNVVDLARVATRILVGSQQINLLEEIH